MDSPTDMLDDAIAASDRRAAAQIYDEVCGMLTSRERKAYLAEIRKMRASQENDVRTAIS